jgi:hypothetical protein
MNLRSFPLTTDTFTTALAAVEGVMVDTSVSAGIGAV